MTSLDQSAQQQKNYLLWCKDRGLRIPVFKESPHQAPQSYHLCILVNSSDLEIPDAGIMLQRLIAALGLMDHEFKIERINEPGNIVDAHWYLVFNGEPKTRESCLQLIGKEKASNIIFTHSVENLMTTPSLKKDTWTVVQPIKKT